MIRTRAELMLDALKVCSDQYSTFAARFAALDSKAQGTSTIAGVLLGSALAFVPQSFFVGVVHIYGSVATYPIRALLACAVGAIVLCVYALEVKSSPIPYRGEDVSRRTIDLMALNESDLSDSVLSKHYLLQVEEWQRTLAEFGVILNRKARALRLAQAALVAAGFSIAVFVWLALDTFK